MRDERRRVVAGGAVAVLTVLAVAFASLAGPTLWSPPRWRFAALQPPLVTSQPQPSASRPPAPQTDGPSETQQVLTLLLMIAVCLAVAVVLFRILRRLQALQRVRRDAAARGLAVISTVDSTPQSLPAAEPIVRGLARALQILDEERTADDAIVQAWLGLEDASAASGAGRRPAETPSEYAARVVSRFDADRQAVAVLLGLYQGVRFGGRHADEQTVATARACLHRLAESWHEDASAGGR